MLGWYNTHRRAMPWRALPGQTSNPYHVWLSEIMLQQTTVPAVIPYFLKFIQIWPTVRDLAAADPQDVLNEWAGLGYYARARNLHKCAKVIMSEYCEQFPDTEKELLKLPGVGPYTAAAIAAIAFNRQTNVVDGNVERVMSRVFQIEAPLPKSKEILKNHARALAANCNRPGDYAQSLMDLGAGVCTPKSPKCMMCPVSEMCAARASGNPEAFPKKEPKKAKPIRYGYIYFIENNKGEILLERRPEKGLLGGMIGLPTSDWIEDQNTLAHLSRFKNIKDLKIPEVRHVFTHFELRLTLMRADLNIPKIQASYFWQEKDKIKSQTFPTVFHKAYKLLK